MNRSLLLVALLFIFPPAQSPAETGPSKTQQATQQTNAKASNEINPEAKSLYDDGIERLNMGQISESVERFQRALEIDPEYVEAYSALGRAFFKLRQWDNASQTFRRAMALKAKEPKRQDTLRKNEIPAMAPSNPASKPKGTNSNSADKKTPGSVSEKIAQPEEQILPESDVVKQHQNLNKPLPALPIDRAVAVTTLDSALEPPEVSRAEAQANIKPGDVLSDPPPEMRGNAEAIPPPATIKADLQIDQNITPKSLADEAKNAAVLESGSHSLDVNGLVKNPGTKLLKSETIPLAIVLAEAEPLPDAARVTVARDGDQILETDLNHTADMRFLVQPGDVVTLHPQLNEIFYVGGKVKFPGDKSYRFGMTLTQAIITAGGATSSVAEIVRGGDEEARKRFDLKSIEEGKAADPLIKPRDRIILH
jgi:tetratricopeptide repeat protein